MKGDFINALLASTFSWVKKIENNNVTINDQY